MYFYYTNRSAHIYLAPGGNTPCSATADDPSHHERTLLPRSYIWLLKPAVHLSAPDIIPDIIARYQIILLCLASVMSIKRIAVNLISTIHSMSSLGVTSRSGAIVQARASRTWDHAYKRILEARFEKPTSMAKPSVNNEVLKVQ